MVSRLDSVSAKHTSYFWVLFCSFFAPCQAATESYYPARVNWYVHDLHTLIDADMIFFI